MRRRGKEKRYPLQEAIWIFASPRLRRAYDAADELAPNFRPPPDPSDAPAVLFSGINQALEQMATRGNVRTEMQRSLCEKIKTGRLIAEGVQTKPALGNAPEVIAAFLFEDPKLDNSSVENFGRRFEGVFVSKRDRSDTQESSPATATSKLSPEAKRRPGRPSKTADINSVIDALIAQGTNLKALNRKGATDLVRQKAEELGSDTRTGFSVSAVQRALLDRFGER